MADISTRYFIVPAILFDRGVYPRCFALSEDAFRLYIYLCSSAWSGDSTTYAGQRAAKKYLGFKKKERYNSALCELKANQFILHYRSLIDLSIKSKKELIEDLIISAEMAAEYDELQPIKKKPETPTHQIPNPPLFKNPVSQSYPQSGPNECICDENNIFNMNKTPLGFIRIPADFVYAKRDKNNTHRYGYLAEMPPDYIDCYFTLLWQNRDHWFGINPNFVRAEIPFLKCKSNKIGNLTNYFRRFPQIEQNLCISPTFAEMMQKSEDEIVGIINSLICKQKLFKWQFWIASHNSYHEERRSIKMFNLSLRYYVDIEKTPDSLEELIEIAGKLTHREKNLQLIGQLRSCLRLNPAFEKLADVNCERCSFSPNDAFIVGIESIDDSGNVPNSPIPINEVCFEETF